MRPFTQAGPFGSTHVGSSVVAAGVVFIAYVGIQVSDYLESNEAHRVAPWHKKTMRTDLGFLTYVMGYSALCAQPRWARGAVLATCATPVILIALDDKASDYRSGSRLDELRGGDLNDLTQLAAYSAVFGLCVWGINRVIARLV